MFDGPPGGATPPCIAMPRSLPALALALIAVLALPAAAPAAKRAKLYVSLGDSYATGYQATGPGQGEATDKGFADFIPREARRRGHRLKLRNFGCGGETTTSILTRKTACAGPAVGAPSYRGKTQIAAATRFIRRNRGRVKLITVSIGGNDVTACVSAVDPIACVNEAVADIEENVGKVARRVRAAAGRKARIVGLTYPDVVLGEWVSGDPARQELARLSVVAFQALINPALKEAYESVDGRFVDVTRKTGAYGSLEETVTLAPYGAIPVPVAEVCRLTYYCEFGDIHARTSGYRLIADLVARTLPRRR
jgi:lysophospholipase L1-like esterase